MEFIILCRRIKKSRHSGRDAGIQRPWMAIFGLLQAIRRFPRVFTPLCKRGAGGIESPNCDGGRKPIPPNPPFAKGGTGMFISGIRLSNTKVSPPCGLDSGIPAGMTTFLALSDLCITTSVLAWEQEYDPLPQPLSLQGRWEKSPINPQPFSLGERGVKTKI